jgi:hypothetical protein
MDSPYHVVFMFLTESNPGGGWWWNSSQQTSEYNWLGMIDSYSKIATSALTARIFGICCGINLRSEESVDFLLRGMNE